VQLRRLNVEPIAGEVVDPTGIFDMQCYIYFINTYCSFEYMMLILVFLKQDLWSEVFMEVMMMVHGDDILDVDD
jgi:hypothetical protein